MIYLEELIEAVLTEEGQFLMGLPFVIDTLGLNMDRMSILLKKSILEYAKRRPYKATDIFYGLPVYMPEGTIAVRAVRYGVLPELPRYYMDTFGEVGYDYDRYTRKLTVWPPITPVKVTYDKGYTLSNSLLVELAFEQSEGDTTLVETIPCACKKGTITVTKGDLSMVEVAREEECTEEGGVTSKRLVSYLEGGLGNGTIDLTNREIELNLNDDTEGSIILSYYPMYKGVVELDIGDFAFTKLFASKMLEALASLRSQATQDALHQIDLTSDDLYSRVRILKREVRDLLRSTTSFSGMFNI